MLIYHERRRGQVSLFKHRKEKRKLGVGRLRCSRSVTLRTVLSVAVLTGLIFYKIE